MSQIKKILLVNLPFTKIYEDTTFKNVIPCAPPIGLACIGGSLLREGHIVKVFDFNLSENNGENFSKKLREFNPDFVGISFTTPLIKECDEISKIVKGINKDIVVMAGGPHCSSFPKSSLKETSIDIAIVGEGDITVLDIVNGHDLDNIKGIAYKKEGKMIINERRELIKDLDTLPFPAHQLYDLQKYNIPLTVTKKNPVVWIETSRGCIYGCTYCNKSVFGKIFRAKSPKRVVEEFIRAKEMGVGEIHLADDGFTTDIKRAKKICDLLIEKKVNISWCPFNGIRVDRVDLDLLKKMKKACCYRVYFGIESGSQRILNSIKKGITLEQIRNAVKLSKEAGLEVVGYFMIGLPEDTEESIKETIKFAKSLDLDLAKMCITIPIPATELFDLLDKKKLIKTYQWDRFKFHSPLCTVYDHPNLSWQTIEDYYNKFYRSIYIRPSFILKRIIYSIKNKTLIDDIKVFLSMDWF